MATLKSRNSDDSRWEHITSFGFNKGWPDDSKDIAKVVTRDTEKANVRCSSLRISLWGFELQI